MKIQNTKYKYIVILALATLLSGCPLEGDKGSAGPAGATGLAGINCWDLNGDRVNDQSEDVNLDGRWNAADCAGRSSNAAQSAEADLNHQHICEALANLGQYPEGCPSNTHTVPTGTLTKMTGTTFFDDGMDGYTSCNNAPNNGLLSIKARDNVNADGDPVQQGWYELEGGYIASQTIMPLLDAVQGVCQSSCQSDPNCIASLAIKNSTEASECSIFYHSDTVSKFERLCGITIPGTTARDFCVTGLDSNAIWASKCP